MRERETVRAPLARGREHIVASVDEVPPGQSKVVPIGRWGVGVYNVNGRFYAIANYCPHEGGPLCAGRTHGQTVKDGSVPGGAVEADESPYKVPGRGAAQLGVVDPARGTTAALAIARASRHHQRSR